VKIRLAGHVLFPHIPFPRPPNSLVRNVFAEVVELGRKIRKADGGVSTLAE
jgi:hypothetical protein